LKACLACGEHFIADSWECPVCGAGPQTAEGFLGFALELTEGTGFEPSYFSELAELESSNFWFRSRNQLIVEMLRLYFPTAGNFLEIGCGTGYVLSGISCAFPRLHLYGSELFCAGLHFARQRLPQATLYQMDARAIPFAEEFDAIGIFDVLEHIADDGQVLQEVHRALRPGGGLLLTVPQHPWLWSRADVRACHVRRYRAGALRRRLEAAGFEILRVTSFVAWLLPLLALTRWVERLRPASPPAGFGLPAPVNRLLELVLDLERATIAAGLRYPCGGSLLVAARKR
jgi:SAM-dependent methyltransferase